MDGPGMTIFQGGESIKLDTSINRAEEEEAIEDQRRRDEELGNQLQNAFDDLIDDEEYTVNNSADLDTHYEHHNEQRKTSSDNGSGRQSHQEFHYANLLANAEHRPDTHDKCRFEVEQLNKSVESKSREIENLTKLVHEERKRNEELKKRLALSEAEKERAQMGKAQTHELLVDSKAKICEIEVEKEKLRATIKSLEDKNNEITAELERTKLQLTDFQHKYRMVERNASYSADTRAENLVKEANERHMAQIMLLQQQTDNLRDKLDAKEREYSSLNVRYNELQKNREALLVEKSEVINQLARKLEDAQNHCQELMCNKDTTQENRRLKGLVLQYERQTEDMQKTINDLTSRLDATAAELNSMEEIMGQNSDFIENLRRMSVGNRSATVNDRVLRLKDELYRCIAGLKEKREEVRRLQDQNVKLNEDIEKLRKRENDALINITTTKEDNLRLSNKLRLLETEITDLKKEWKHTIDTTADLQQKLGKLKTENESVCAELENMKKDCESTKNKNIELQIEIDGLTETLKSKSESELLIKTLKEKALQFEEYIKSGSNSVNLTPKQDRAVSTTPDLDEMPDSDRRRQIETNIRNEMAKIFASKIKSIETTLEEKSQILEAQNTQLKQDLHSLYTELQTREKEVTVLKHAIVKEREKMYETLDTKSMQMHEINNILEKSRDELNLKQQHIRQLQQELKERSEQMEAERKSMKAVMQNWNKQQLQYEKINKEMEEKLQMLKEKYEKSQENMLKKYNAAKKTAANYKKYAEDKEKHMLAEYDRLKTGYKTALDKVELQMKNALEKQEKLMKDRIGEIEATYKEKIRKMGSSPSANIPSL